MNSAANALSQSQITLIDIPPASVKMDAFEKQTSRLGKAVRKMFLTGRKHDELASQIVRLQVSLWLTCYRPPDQELELWLHFEDDDKFVKILIDTQKLNDGHSLLFEGIAEMEVEGKLHALTLKCSGMAETIPFKVEDFSLRKF